MPASVSVASVPLRRKFRVSEVPIHTTLPRQLAEQLITLADRESSTVAGITRRAIASFVHAQMLGVARG